MNITKLPFPLSGVALLLFFHTSCSTPGNTPPKPGREDQRLEEARGLYQQGQLDEALLITDALVKADPGLREAWLLAADANLALARSGRTPTNLFIQDAIRNLKRACRKDDKDADIYMQMSEAYLQLGEQGAPNWEAGRDAALKAAALYAKQRAGTEKVGEAVLLAAKHELRIFIEARRPELAAGEQTLGAGTFEKANAVMARLEKAKQTGTEATRGDAYVQASLTWEWMGRTLEAILELERGLAVAPNHRPLHDRFQQLHNRMERQAECAAAYKRVIRQHGKTPGLLYGLALSHANLADARRRARKYTEAAAAYRTTAEACDEVLRLETNNPASRQYYTDWKAIIHLSMSSLQLEAGDIEAAKREAFLAYEATPRVLEVDANGYPLLRGYGGASYLLCIEDIGRALVTSRDSSSLRAGLHYWEEIIARHPNLYGWVYNNAGLCARDLGSSLANPRGVEPEEREQALREAMAMWERSYAHYTKAAALSPQDPRIVNDCGLMLVYHLKRDYDVAMKLFQQAIVTGKEQLAALPDDTDRQQRENLEEAVGDAYQNTAVMFQNQGKPYAEYEDLLKEAVKYYPYQMRQAARMLRNQPRQQPEEKEPVARARPRPEARATEFRETLTEAGKKAEAADFDGALLVLDRVQARMEGYAPFHYHVGLYSLRYGEQSMKRGGSSTQVASLLADARIQLQKAVQLDGDPVEPRLYLARANYESGEFVNAAKISESLLSHIASLGGTGKRLHCEALEVRARAGKAIFLQSRGESELQAARNAFRALEQMGGMDVRLACEWSDLESSAGRKAEAVAILVRAAERAPDNQDVLGTLVSRASEHDNSAMAVAALADRKDAVGLWYLGLAHQNHARELLAAGKEGDKEGLEALAKSTGAFLASMRANEAFSNNCKARIAICLGEEGYVHMAAGRHDRAEQAFLAAAKERPDRVAASFESDPTRSVKRGLLLLIENYYRQKNLAAGERLSRSATDLLPADADLANNHGLLARDHGVALEAAGNRQGAVAMWEAALASYQRAARLEPHNLRLVNDLALMQIYHLHRDLPQAKASLQQCIRLAEQRLKDDPPTDKQALADLQETLGDCHENLGYCLMVHDKDFEGARRHLKASLEYVPFEKRNSTRHLRRLNELTGKQE